MTQGRKRQAWKVMTKLLPTAVFIDIENDKEQNDCEINEVC